MSLSDESVFREARLCVVGNINRDVKTPPLPSGDYLFRDGETPLAFVQETIGGGGANSAAIAAGLGAQVAFVGQVGADALGDRLERALTRAGVRCHLRRAPGLATGTTLNLNFDTGRRHFLSCHPNNLALDFATLDLAPLPAAQHLLRADIWFSEPMLFGGNERLLRAARAAGVSTSIDLNWDPLWGHAPEPVIARRKDAVRAILPLVDLAHGNVRELREFTGAADLAGAVACLLDAGIQAVVAHLGAEGAGWFSQTLSHVEPAVPVARPVHNTGTGDVLSTCVMLLHGRHGLSVADQLRLANRLVAEFMEGRRVFIPALEEPPGRG